MSDVAVRGRPANETTRLAQQDTVLSPRFYTTDFAAMERIDVSGVRAEWDALIAEIAGRYQQGPFHPQREVRRGPVHAAAGSAGGTA